MEEQIVKHININQDKLQDSLECGSSAKGVCLKVYFDAGNPEEAKKRIDEALKLREYLKLKTKEVE